MEEWKSGRVEEWKSRAESVNKQEKSKVYGFKKLRP